MLSHQIWLSLWQWIELRLRSERVQRSIASTSIWLISQWWRDGGCCCGRPCREDHHQDQLDRHCCGKRQCQKEAIDVTAIANVNKRVKIICVRLGVVKLVSEKEAKEIRIGIWFNDKDKFESCHWLNSYFKTLFLFIRNSFIGFKETVKLKLAITFFLD